MWGVGDAGMVDPYKADKNRGPQRIAVLSNRVVAARALCTCSCAPFSRRLSDNFPLLAGDRVIGSSLVRRLGEVRTVFLGKTARSYFKVVLVAGPAGGASGNSLESILLLVW